MENQQPNQSPPQPPPPQLVSVGSPQQIPMPPPVQMPPQDQTTILAQGSNQAESKGLPVVVVVAAILLGVSLIVMGFFAYENYQLRQQTQYPASS